MSAILVLWDIDHTLVENHGVNKETYALAFRLLTGCEAEQRARTDGRTEPEIMRDLLFLDFEVGGYGSDDEVRANLVAIAQARAIAKYGETFDKANTTLVGDTPRDVRAGRDGGARVVGVATGTDSVESLRAAGADVVLPDLGDTRAVAEAVTSLAG